MANRLPTELKKCPIKEAILEVRFESEFPVGAVFGIAYSALKDLFLVFEPLPILQLPESVRDNDPDLAFQAHYRAKREHFLVQIGPKMVSINCLEPYSGWQEYKKEIHSVLQALVKVEVISKVARVGLRYRNIFRDQILDQIKFSVAINDTEVKNRETSFRTVFEEEDGFKTILHIAGEVVVTEADAVAYSGSLIDIDVSLASDNIPLASDAEKILETSHRIQKEHFFELLKDDLLTTFEPVYE